MENLNKQINGLDVVESGFGGNDNNQMMEIIMDKECDMQKMAQVEIGSEPMEVAVTEHEVNSLDHSTACQQMMLKKIPKDSVDTSNEPCTNRWSYLEEAEDNESRIDGEIELVTDIIMIDADVIDYASLVGMEEVLARIADLQDLVDRNNVVRIWYKNLSYECYVLLETPEGKYYIQELADNMVNWRKPQYLRAIINHRHLAAILETGVQAIYIQNCDIDMDIVLS